MICESTQVKLPEVVDILLERIRPLNVARIMELPANITHLTIRWCDCESWKLIAEAVAKLSCLTSFAIINCSNGDSVIKPLLVLTNLTELTLKTNISGYPKISDEGVILICTHFKNLTSLDLGN